MTVGVIATDFGPHSPEDLAIATAAQLIQIAAEASGLNAAKGRKLELRFIDILEDAHGVVQKHERGEIEKYGHERLSHPLDATSHVDDPFDAIVAAAAAVKGARPGTTSAIAKHYTDPDVQAAVRAVLQHWFQTSMSIERGWHADGSVIGDDNMPTPNPEHDPDNTHVRAFNANRVVPLA